MKRVKVVGFMCIFFLAAVFVTKAWAQGELDQLKEELKAMREKMESLQKRIEQLEQEDKAKVEKIEALSAELQEQKSKSYELGEGVTPFGKERIKLSGYYSLHYEESENSDGSFDLHEVELYVDIPISDKFKAFTSLEWEHGGAFEAGETGEGEIKIVQGWLDWYISQWANLRFGKILTPFSDLNLIHADPLLPTDQDPLMVKRGRLPTTSTGVEFFGSVFPAEWEINYWLGVGNGKGPAPNSSDVNQDKTFYGRIAFSPPLGNKGKLKLGLSGMSGEDGNLNNAEENVVGTTFFL